jgi:hypothetical protein
MITAALVAGGVVLVTGGVTAGLGPIALVCGVLMLWSGVVKVIVLRIWRTTLSCDAAPDRSRLTNDSEPAIGQRS